MWAFTRRQAQGKCYHAPKQHRDHKALKGDGYYPNSLRLWEKSYTYK